jgi:hypothetical protein
VHSLQGKEHNRQTRLTSGYLPELQFSIHLFVFSSTIGETQDKQSLPFELHVEQKSGDPLEHGSHDLAAEFFHVPVGQVDRQVQVPGAQVDNCLNRLMLQVVQFAFPELEQVSHELSHGKQILRFVSE